MRVVLWNPKAASGRPSRVARTLSKVADFRPESALAKILQTVRKLDAGLHTFARDPNFVSL